MSSLVLTNAQRATTGGDSPYSYDAELQINVLASGRPAVEDTVMLSAMSRTHSTGTGGNGGTQIDD